MALHSSRVLLKFRRWRSVLRSYSVPAADTSCVGGTPLPSLNVEMPGLPKLKAATDLPLPTTKITTLSNGVTVASHEDYGQVSSVGVFVNAGSAMETAENNGTAYLVEKIAFRSTQKRSSHEIARAVEDIGGNAITNSSREQIVYQIEFLRSELRTAIELLADNVVTPLFLDEDIAETKEMIKFEQEDLQYDPQVLVQEWLHEAAFGKGTRLGQPLVALETQMDTLGAPHLKAFLRDYFVGSNIIVAAAGVDHDELVALADANFSSLPLTSEANSVSKPTNTYFGGEVRIEKEPPQQAVSETFVAPPPPMTHVMLAFDTGGWLSDDLVPLCVLHTLLGGGSSFSAGGPGKGMYTRLYREVLNQHYWVDSAIATSVMLYDHGLLGIYGTSEPKNAFALVKTLCEQFYKIGFTNASEEETSRARNQLKSRVLMNLESRNILCEDIGRQLLTYGYREQASSLCSRIDKVSSKDLLRVSRKMLKTAPSMVSYGDLSNVPSYEEVKKFFGQVSSDL